MDEVTKNFLLTKTHTLKNLTQADTDFLVALNTKTSEDILELQGMLTPLQSRQNALSMEDFSPVEKAVKLSAAVSRIQLLVAALQHRKDLLGCCLKGLRACSSELTSLADDLREIPFLEWEEDDTGSNA